MSFNKPTSAADLAEFEALAGLTTADIKNTGTSRWERKKAALKNSMVTNTTPSKRARQEDASSCTPSKSANGGDRFIPHRSSMDMNFADDGENSNTQVASEYRKMLASGLGLRNGEDARDHRVLAFKQKAPVADDVRQLQL